MVLVGGHTALVGCAVAVRTSDGAVAGEGLRACGRTRKESGDGIMAKLRAAHRNAH